MLGSITAIPQGDDRQRQLVAGHHRRQRRRDDAGSAGQRAVAVQAVTVPDASITTAKIAAGAVTSAKMMPEAYSHVPTYESIASTT
jgi:hypothetical protein